MISDILVSHISQYLYHLYFNQISISKSSINIYIYMLLKALSQVNVIHVKIY